MERESNFELLRITSMAFIVIYHLMTFLVNIFGYSFETALIPLHVGVILFVLISGYFHISLSVKSLCRLFAPLLILYLPIELMFGGAKVSSFLILSPYWFVRVFFYLMLLSPMLNTFLTCERRRIFSILSLGFISVYMAWRGGDVNMADGKNVVLFMLIYTIGDFMHSNIDRIKRISYFTLLCGFLLLNSISIGCLLLIDSEHVYNIIWRTSFPYSSPLLILSGSILFMLFCKFTFHSTIINKVAVSIFSVYILSEHPVIKEFIIEVVMKKYIHYFSGNLLPILSMTLLLSIVIIFLCVLVDQLFQPVYRIICAFCLYARDKVLEKMVYPIIAKNNR